MLSQTDRFALDELIHQLQWLDQGDESRLTLSVQENVKEYTELSMLLVSLQAKISEELDKVTPLTYDINKEEMIDPLQKELQRRTTWHCTVDPALQEAYQKESTKEQLAVIMRWIYKRQLNGMTRLLSHKGYEIVKYDISGKFFAMYCAKNISLFNTHIIDLSCRRCEVCEQHHLALHLVAWGKELEERVRVLPSPFQFTCNYFSNVEWRCILRPVPSQCIENGRRWLPAATKWDGRKIVW